MTISQRQVNFTPRRNNFSVDRLSPVAYVQDMKQKTPIRQWLKSQHLSATWLGHNIGLGPTQSADIVSGRATPSLAQRMAIELLTGGAIRRDQWGATTEFGAVAGSSRQSADATTSAAGDADLDSSPALAGPTQASEGQPCRQ